MHDDLLPARIDDDDHAGTRFQPFGYLVANFGVEVVRGDHFYSQVGRTRPVALYRTYLIETLLTDESGVGCADGIRIGCKFEARFGGVDLTELVGT